MYEVIDNKRILISITNRAGMGCDTDNFCLGYASPHSDGKKTLCTKPLLLEEKLERKKNELKTSQASATLHNACMKCIMTKCSASSLWRDSTLPP